MKHSYTNKAFTLVEMLAVIAVMSIIVALTIPNGIFVRTAGEEQVVKTHAMALELAAQKVHGIYGQRGQQEWATKYSNSSAMVEWLVPMISNKTSANEILRAFDGYDLVFPPSIAGKITVRRKTDGAVVYP